MRFWHFPSLSWDINSTPGLTDVPPDGDLMRLSVREICGLNLEISEPRPDDHPLMAQLCQEGTSIPPGSPAPGSLSPGSLSLVARLDGRLVGLLICGPGSQPDHVRCLYIAPDCQDQGIERALIDKLMMKLRSRGLHTMPMHAITQGSAGTLWENAKWLGQGDFQGVAPIGKTLACPIG